VPEVTRVLLVNKFFFPNAGAETVFFRTRDLLQRHGHDVVDFAMEHPRNLDSPYAGAFAPRRDYGGEGSRLTRVRDAADSIYSVAARRRLRKLLRARRPDIAHLHNIYHQLTLSIVDELASAGIPIILTLHDYKPVCPSYVVYTDGAPCHRCLRGPVVNAIIHKCVKGSLPASAVAAVEAGLARRRGTYHRVDRFIAPSRFMAGVMREGGFDAERISIMPNFLPLEPGTLPAEPPARRHFLFVGRLEEVKGVRLLLEAWRRVPAGTSLRILGAGPLQGLVEKEAAASPDVDFLGFQPADLVRRELDSALALLVPSLVEENCPMAILEARERGCAVVGADRGGLPELIEDGADGLLFVPGDAGSLAEKIKSLAIDSARAERLGAIGRHVALDRYSAERHYDALMDVYAEASESARTR
jgi:glycosyltransferase involved in cell wall biosynthesis